MGEGEGGQYVGEGEGEEDVGEEDEEEEAEGGARGSQAGGSQTVQAPRKRHWELPPKVPDRPEDRILIEPYGDT